MIKQTYAKYRELRYKIERNLHKPEMEHQCHDWQKESRIAFDQLKTLAMTLPIDKWLTVPSQWCTIWRQDDIGLFYCRRIEEFTVARVAVWGPLPDVTLDQCDFFTILTVECSREVPLTTVYPANWRTDWNITEKISDDITVHPKYRKLVGVFTYDQFMDYCGMHDVHFEAETLGSITLRGLLPALAFSNNNWTDYAIHMHVTPEPNLPPPQTETEATLVWETLKQQMKEI